MRELGNLNHSPFIPFFFREGRRKPVQHIKQQGSWITKYTMLKPLQIECSDMKKAPKVNLRKIVYDPVLDTY